MDIDIDNYITEEDKREIARDAYRSRIDEIFKDKERIISNQSYDVVIEMINSKMDDDVHELIRNKAIELIGDLSVYTVFKSPDYWSGSSKGYDLLQESLKSNTDKAKKRVSEIIDMLDVDEMKEFLRDIAAEQIDEKLFGGNKS